MKIPAFMLMLTAVTIVAGLAPVFALEQACPNCMEEDSADSAEMILLAEVPITIWTDQEMYDHDSTIMVKGMVANPVSGFQVTITVIGPTNNIVVVDQLEIDDDGTYMAQLNTAGQMWMRDGIYTIKAHYNDDSVNNKAVIELVGGIAEMRPSMTSPMGPCEGITIDGYCVPYTIEGGSVTGGTINAGTSIIIDIESIKSGKIVLSPEPDVFSGLELVFVDGEQWDDIVVDGNDIKVYFPAGTEEIEIVGTHVVPEFGTIAALVLAAALVSIIAVSARSRLSIIPRY